jgi:3-(methylthio)propanoyl-CoA dehydrogenase
MDGVWSPSPRGFGADAELAQHSRRDYALSREAAMANFYEDNEDLRFYVEKAIDWRPLVELAEHDLKAPDAPASTEEAVELYRDVLRLFGRLSAEEIAPKAAQIDREGLEFRDGNVVFPPVLDAIFQQFKELELHGLSIPRELGGINSPLLVYFLATELIARADVSVVSHYGFHGGIGLAMLIYSATEGSTEFDRERRVISKTRWEREIRECGRGDAWGSMDITEPDAGSDMAALRARAEQDEHGNWHVTGQKIFITSGHGKYHFVIARTDGEGLEGLSLFLVRAYEDDENGERRWLATFERIEEKCGHHGSPTVAISFDRTPAELVGERGQGFRGMLLLMNNARIGVGFESIGLAQAAYEMAREYAAQRGSMGKTIDQHEMIADYLEEMRTDIQGLRALAVEAAWLEEQSQRLRIRARTWYDADSPERTELERRARELGRRARQLTPLLKYQASEKAVEIARRAIQIHGGAGYTKEYGAERLLRDALVMPIYEGTSQIQSLMAMKDAMTAIMRNPQGFLRRLAQTRWRALSSRDALERRVAELEALEASTQQLIMRRVATDKLRSLGGRPVTTWTRELFQNWDPKRDFSFAMLHAERLTRLLADVAIARVLLAQAQRFPQRRELLARHLERAEIRCRALHDEITSRGDSLLRALRERRDDEARAAQ